MSAPALVLDTNTVMALWVFQDPGLAALRAAIEADTYPLYSRTDALEELRCVLAYAQFGLPPHQQSTLFDTYVRRCTMVPATSDAATGVLPRCRDSDDQKFLEITRDAGAQALLTRDKALLRLARHRLIRERFRICPPDGFSPPD